MGPVDGGGDPYDRTVRLDFVRFLRDEPRFDSVDSLVEQMRRDVEWTPPVCRWGVAGQSGI